jgi:hypothetical protein
MAWYVIKHRNNFTFGTKITEFYSILRFGTCVLTFRSIIQPLFSRYNLKIHITVLRVMTPSSLIGVFDLHSASIFKVEEYPYCDLLGYDTLQADGWLPTFRND